jgi:hypothetical protein
LYGAFHSFPEKEIYGFQKDIINDRVWEEPLRFLAERVNRSNGFESESDHADKLIRLTILVDLLLAATLARSVGWKNLTTAHHELSRHLRVLYAKAETLSRRYALICMLATGSDHFTDIYRPLLERVATTKYDEGSIGLGTLSRFQL